MKPEKAPVLPPTMMVPPFWSMPGARADVALADQIAAADRRAEGRAGVLLDHHGPSHHVLGAGPADPAADAHVGPVDQAAAEVAQAALEVELQAVQDADARGRAWRPGFLTTMVPWPSLHQLADLEVDRFCRVSSAASNSARLLKSTSKP